MNPLVFDARARLPVSQLYKAAFCKATGVRLTEYVSRVKVEKAKTLLCSV